jgi:hypothetical protein
MKICKSFLNLSNEIIENIMLYLEDDDLIILKSINKSYRKRVNYYIYNMYIFNELEKKNIDKIRDHEKKICSNYMYELILNYLLNNNSIDLNFLYKLVEAYSYLNYEFILSGFRIFSKMDLDINRYNKIKEIFYKVFNDKYNDFVDSDAYGGYIDSEGIKDELEIYYYPMKDIENIYYLENIFLDIKYLFDVI